jgi:histone H3/H4
LVEYQGHVFFNFVMVGLKAGSGTGSNIFLCTTTLPSYSLATMPSATQGQSSVSKGVDPSSKAGGSSVSYVPRDARLMALILDSMGVQDVQPPVLMMLLEFAHRYLYEVLQDSLVYADHANSSKTTNAGVSTLTLDDIQLAIQSRVNHSFTGPPSKEVSR